MTQPFHDVVASNDASTHEPLREALAFAWTQYDAVERWGPGTAFGVERARIKAREAVEHAAHALGASRGVVR